MKLNMNMNLRPIHHWDIEDEENKALEGIVPGLKPPDQPYQNSDKFEDTVPFRIVQHGL